VRAARAAVGLRARRDALLARRRALEERVVLAVRRHLPAGMTPLFPRYGAPMRLPLALALACSADPEDDPRTGPTAGGRGTPATSPGGEAGGSGGAAGTGGLGGAGATGGSGGMGGAGGTAGTGGTGGSAPSAIYATCAVQPANVLRADCTVNTGVASAIVLTFTSGAGERLVFRRDEPAESHSLTAWGLLADTEWTWEATATDVGATVSGTLATPSVPGYADVAPDVTGTPTIGAVAMPFGCGRSDVLVIVDAAGRLRWYQELAEGSNIDGVGFLPDSAGFLAILDNERLIEVAVDGTVTKDWTMSDLGIDKQIHHAAFSAGGITYVITAEEQVQGGRDLVIDGVLGLDLAGNVVQEWNVADATDPWDLPIILGGAAYWAVPFPGAEDVTHANGVHVDENNGLTVSLLQLDTVLHVDFDPLSPTYRQTLWTLAGNAADAPVGTDFTITASAGGEANFTKQHHPVLHDGTLLTLSDNRSPTLNARTVEIELDASSGTADIVQKHKFGASCPVQGSVFLQDDGSVIAACSGSKTVYQFADGSGDTPQWTLAMSCDGVAFSAGILSQAHPFELPEEAP
jgi:hypothetical protein